MAAIPHALAQGSYGGSMESTSLAMPPLTWQKMQYEEKLFDSLKRDISLVIPPEQFVLTVAVRIREAAEAEPEAKKPTRGGPAGFGAVDGVLDGGDLMSKLGVDSPYMSPEMIKKQEDLFENIASISVEVLLDSRVDAAREEIVKNLLDRISPTFKDVKPKIAISRIDILPPPVVKSEPQLIDWVREFKDPAGRTVAIILLGMIIFLVSFLALSKIGGIANAAIAAFKEFTAVQQEAATAKAGIGASSMASDSPALTAAETSHDQPEAPGDEAASRLISSTQDKELAGVEKFKRLVEQNTQAASYFVRQWIKIRPEGSTDALIILTRSIQPENLVKLFDLLSVDERKMLSKILNYPLSRDALGRADLFLNNQIIMDLITPKPDLAPEVQEMIMAVTEEEISAIAKTQPGAAAALLNMMPANQMVKIAETLANDVCEQIFPICATLSMTNAVEQIAVIKNQLSELRGQAEQSPSPFLESVPDLMVTANPNKERILYAVLSQAKQWSMIDRLSAQYFPAFLVTQLAPDVIKDFFLMLSNVKRAELVVSQATDARQVFLAAAGEPGKKLRDILDLEVAELESDEDTKEKITHTQEKIWMEFVKVVRQNLKTDAKYVKAAKAVLNDWTEKLKGDSNVVNLNQAAGGGDEQNDAA